MSKPNTATQSNVQTQPATKTATKAVELIELSSLPITEYVTKAGEKRRGVRLHSLSFLPQNGEHKPVFGGFVSEMVDPLTGEVRGKDRDSVALQFFGETAVQLSAILEKASKRDAVILAFTDPAAPGKGSVHRLEDGRIKQIAVGSREFDGRFKLLVAAPPIDLVEE